MLTAIEQFVSYLRSCYAPELVELIRLESHSAATLRGCLDHAAVAVIVGSAELDRLLAHQGITPTFVGWAGDGQRVAVLDRRVRLPRAAPRSFRVAAIMPVFNEADVIEHTLDYLLRDRIGVYVIDNWSTDATLNIVRQFEGRGLLGVERFPPAQPPGAYDLRAILTRVEEVGPKLDADWLILHDADERRRAPWPDVSLRDALFEVDRAGFTCVDHITLNFWPTDNGFRPEHELEGYFSHFEFSTHPGHFHQRRAWKKVGQGVSLARTAGHDVGFAGRRVFPYKFLLKHYPLRSQAHAEQKVLRERRARWNRAERSLGWHQQYDDVERFVRDPAELLGFDARTFYERYLLERLSGVGLFDRPPEWATPPLWHDTPTAAWPTATPADRSAASRLI